MTTHKDEIEAANARAAAQRKNTPIAIAAHYDTYIDRLVIDLSTGLSIMFKPHDAQGLEKAKPEHLTKIEISPAGFGLHFPALDADLYFICPDFSRVLWDRGNGQPHSWVRPAGVQPRQSKPPPRAQTANQVAGQRNINRMLPM